MQADSTACRMIDQQGCRKRVESTRNQFLLMATVFQGGIALLAFALAWLLGMNPFDGFDVTFEATAIGIGGTIPMFLLFAITYRYPVGPLGRVKRFLVEGLGPCLSECRWYDLVWVAFLAGASEELLFRAVLQRYLTAWGTVPALLISNIVFGAVHAVTLIYPFLAGLLGVYLGSLYQFAGSGNLFVPTVAHTFYDFVAFLIVRRTYFIQLASEEGNGPLATLTETTEP
jgi:membrane protease YdiL (CAAX protease family)